MHVSEITEAVSWLCIEVNYYMTEGVKSCYATRYAEIEIYDQRLLEKFK